MGNSIGKSMGIPWMLFNTVGLPWQLCPKEESYHQGDAPRGVMDGGTQGGFGGRSSGPNLEVGKGRWLEGWKVWVV